MDVNVLPSINKGSLNMLYIILSMSRKISASALIV